MFSRAVVWRFDPGILATFGMLVNINTLNISKHFLESIGRNFKTKSMKSFNSDSVAQLFECEFFDHHQFFEYNSSLPFRMRSKFPVLFAKIPGCITGAASGRNLHGTFSRTRKKIALEYVSRSTIQE